MTQPSESGALGILWTLRLDGPLPAGPEPRIPATFERAVPEIAAELAHAMGFDSPDPVLQRFRQGKQCYIARVDGKLASYGWLTFDKEDIGELGLTIRLKPGEAYIWDCATLPAYRGRRLYPALLAHMLRELQRQGYQRIWIGTDAGNLPSQAGVALAGCRPVLEIVRAPRGGYLSRGRPGAALQDLLDAHYALFGAFQSQTSQETRRVPAASNEETILLTSAKVNWHTTSGGAPMSESSKQFIGPHQNQPCLQAGEALEQAQAAMILVHGRGASAQDILGLAAEFRVPGFAYLAPQAAGYTWYPYSFLAPIASNEPWLSSALAVIASLLDSLAEHGIPAQRTILLGFSQGACLSLEFAARHARRYGGVVGLSGGLIGPDDTPRNYPGSLEGTPVFLGCSDIDPHIPKERVLESAGILRRLGGDVTVQLYEGMGHTVNLQEIRSVQNMMKALLDYEGFHRID